MKSQKGVTMISLVIYVSSFLVIAGIVGAITTYFYNNMDIVEASASSSAEYNKLNVYLLKQTKSSDVTLVGYTDNPHKVVEIDGSDENASYITFKLQNGKENTFVHVNDILYFNKIKLCENVEKFEVNVEEGDKTTLVITVQISNKQYKTKYVIE